MADPNSAHARKRESYRRPPGKPKLSATGKTRGHPRPGSCEYESIRMSSGGAHPYPWRTLDYLAERLCETTLYTNPWEREVLRYAASLEGTSVSKYVLEHGVRAALKRILRQESGGAEAEPGDEREAG